MAKIVISYRRSDSAAIAGRICDQLKLRYGDESVYVDIDNIPLGIDFRDHIHAALDQADALIAIVGPKWLGTRRNGRHRIKDDHDPVRMEVETALNRNIPVVPLLVDGATMPAATNLPDSMQAFPFRNAATIHSGVDFHQQIDRLVRSLDLLLKTSSPAGAPAKRFKGMRSSLRVALAGVAVAGAFFAATVWWLAPFAPKVRPFVLSGKQQTVPDVGGPFVPPPGRTLWIVEKSTVFLEPTGDRRQFFLIEPNPELTVQGARPGSLLFDGRKDTPKSYEGKLFVFAGRCGTRDYDVSGPITNDDETVTLTGKVPRIDPETCQRLDEQDRTIIFNYKQRIE